MNKIERQFEMAKFLHKPRTENEIKNKFDLSDSTLSHMFKENKVRFMNVEFPLFKRKISGKNEFVSDSKNAEMLDLNIPEYKSTVHPIVLPLNLTELYALTNHLLDITKNNPEEYKVYKEIVDKIYPQLSEYAKRQLGDNRHYLKEDGVVKFTNEEDMFVNCIPSILMYALKSSENIKFILKEGKEIIGSVYEIDGNIVIETNKEEFNYSDIKYDILSIEKVAN